MSGLKLNMGLGGSAGAAGYVGPVYSATGAASVPGSSGYPDTGRQPTIAQLAFGPGAGSGAGGSPAHATWFGIGCTVLLVAMWWALPK